MSIVESWMPWLFRLETPGLVIFTSLLIALYFWVTETDVGLAITAPWTIKNDRERMAFCSLYRPGFQASELGLLAAFWLLEAVLLGLQGAYYQVIWIGAGLVVLNLLLRLGSAWRNAKAIKGARAIRFVHALVSVVTVIYLVTVGLHFARRALCGLENDESAAREMSRFGIGDPVHAYSAVNHLAAGNIYACDFADTGETDFYWRRRGFYSDLSCNVCNSA